MAAMAANRNEKKKEFGQRVAQVEAAVGLVREVRYDGPPDGNQHSTRSPSPSPIDGSKTQQQNQQLHT
ncbi:hypothetical protein BS3272_11345 [Bifidobacterium subtile]|jgi:hypothetical protein|nr:hypothetical protein BS3272_11345 [Bifidobacterium subtile]